MGPLGLPRARTVGHREPLDPGQGLCWCLCAPTVSAVLQQCPIDHLTGRTPAKSNQMGADCLA